MSATRIGHPIKPHASQIVIRALDFFGVGEPLSRRPQVSTHGWLKLPRVVDFVARQRTDLTVRNFCHSNCRTIESGEFHQEICAAVVNMHNRAHVACRQAMLRQIHGQRHAIEFSNHV